MLIRTLLLLLLFPALAFGGPRYFDWGEVEDFDTDDAVCDMVTWEADDICYSNDMATTSYQSSGGWDDGGFLRFTITATDDPWEDDGGCTEIYFPEATAHVYVFWMERVGTAWWSGINPEEFKHSMVYSTGASPDRPTLFNRHVNDGGSLQYRIFQAANDANGGGIQDEFGNAAPENDYPDHTHKQNATNGQEWIFICWEINNSGNNTIYLWSRDGTLDGSAYATTPNTNTYNSLYARIFAYHEGADVDAIPGSITANTYIDIDYIGVDNSKPSPPSGFVTGAGACSVDTGGAGSAAVNAGGAGSITIE